MATINTTVVKLSEFPPTLPNIPANYPSTPVPGKIQLLFDANAEYLYSKFSPYTNYQASNVFGGVLSDKQPFIYTQIETGQNNVRGFNSLAGQILDIANINTDTVDDAARISKFLISSWGVSFLAAQLAIQRTAPFDETRIYNPLSPLLATVQPLTLGIGEAPTRHIEPIGSGLLGTALGALNSLTSTIGINLQNGYSKPSSTAGDETALPSTQTGIAGSQGKGMIRGSDAQKAATSLQSKWITSTNQGGLGLGSLLSSAVNNFASSIAGSFLSFFGGAPKAKGIFRTDEGTYVLMADYFGKQGITGVSGVTGGAKSSIIQPWYASPTTYPQSLDAFGIPLLRKNKSTFGIVVSTVPAQSDFFKSKLLSTPDGWEAVDTSNGLLGYYVSNKPTGVPVGDNYGDVVGRVNGDDLTNSEMLVQYSRYVQIDNNYATKIVGPSSDTVKAIQAGLEAVVANIGKSGVYNATGQLQSYLLSDGDPSAIGYDNLYNTTPTSRTDPKTSYGVIKEYRDGDSEVPSIDAGVKSGQVGSNLRMATTFYSDGINRLDVLGKDKSTPDNVSFNSSYPDWIQWDPYKDDLIAFFFYDVVNDTYIPFRATVKAISEGATAFWDELRFIGRADQLYSYNGFSRTLTFSFNIVIGSVMELLPTWKKINYMASSVKPSSYTTGQGINQKFNRFIIPPMFMVTIGDLYKFQPIVITSININIPDDAAWETLNEDNSKLGWSYLNGLITSPSVGKNYGQLPREVEIAVVCNLLEKERAIVGGSNFGHEPRVDDWESKSGDDRFLSNGDVSFLPQPTTLHKGMTQFNAPGQSIAPQPVSAPSAPATVTTPPAVATPAISNPRINRGGQTFNGTPGVG